MRNRYAREIPFTSNQPRKLANKMDRKIENIVRHAEVSEKAIEKYLTVRTKELGGICLKYFNPGAVGYPDRLVLLPGGVTIWVELKSRGKHLQEVQKIRIARLRQLGHVVEVCDSRSAVDQALTKITAL